MKLLVCCIVFFPFLAFAQESSKSTLEEQEAKQEIRLQEKFFLTEIALNSTNLVRAVLNTGGQQGMPYMFNVKMLINPLNTGIKMGMGGNRFTRTVDEGFAQDKEDQKSLDVRLGLEWQFRWTKKLLMSFGVDGFYFSEYNSVSVFNGFEEQRVTDRLRGFGGGPVIGFQYFISERLSIYTETAVYYSEGEGNHDELFSLTPEFNQFDKVKTIELDFVWPTSIFLAMRF